MSHSVRGPAHQHRRRGTKRIDSNKWSELVATGTDYLAELAEERGHVEYAQFNDRVCGGLFNLGDASERDQLGRLLGDISRASVREHDVMLSALVHHKGNVLDVGKGFSLCPPTWDGSTEGQTT